MRQVFTRKCFDLTKGRLQRARDPAKGRGRASTKHASGTRTLVSLPFDMSDKRVKLCFQDPPDLVDPYVRGAKRCHGMSSAHLEARLHCWT